MNRFEFATVGRIIFGSGRLREAGTLGRELGSRALVVTGKDKDRAEQLLTILGDAGVSSVTFSVPHEPEIKTVNDAAALARKEACDMVIAFGGGSALDAGKAASAMLTNKGDLLEYLEIIGGGKPLTQPAAPFMAIPTTAGTGSEVTRNAVLASPEHRLKVSLRSPLMLPKVALVDPELTYDLPPAITAFTGLDALTQLIEPFVCVYANPFTDALCSEAIPRVTRSLRVVTGKGTDAKSREDMAVASLFGGLSLSNAGLGAVHGFAGPIGGMFPAPHGAVCAVLLPHVMEANWRALQERPPQNGALERFHQLARLLTNRNTATAEQGIQFVRTFVNDLQIPPLRTYGVTKSHTELLVQKAAKANSMKANPIQLTPVELAEALEKAL